MNQVNSDWTVRHFSQANPLGTPGQEDVAELLRRIASTIDDLGEVEVQDVVFHNQIIDGRDWPSITVYYHGTNI